MASKKRHLKPRNLNNNEITYDFTRLLPLGHFFKVKFLLLIQRDPPSLLNALSQVATISIFIFCLL